MKIAPRGDINGFKYNNHGVLTMFLPSFKDWFLSQPASVEAALVKEKLLLDRVTTDPHNIDTMINSNPSRVGGKQPRKVVISPR